VEGEQTAAESALGWRLGRGIKTERLREYLAVLESAAGMWHATKRAARELRR
jgi:hypothetical protein